MATWMMVWMVTSCGEDRMTYVGDNVERIMTWKMMSMATSFNNVDDDIDSDDICCRRF